MRFSILLLAFLSSFITNGQDLKKDFADDLCICLEEVDNISSNNKVLENCFAQTIVNYQNQFSELIDTASSLPEYDQGRILGRTIYYEMQPYLIQNCDYYFDLMEKVRMEVIKGYDKKNYESDIDSITNLINKYPSSSIYWARGIIHLKAENLKEAKKDFSKALELNKSSTQSKYFLGFVNELSGQFDKALELYTEVYKETNEPKFLMIIEIVKRKKKEKK